MHICHLITGLGTGGTPVMLRKVLEALRDSSLRFTVIGMIDDNAIGERIEAIGIPVHRLGMTPGRISPRGFARLVKLLRNDPPDLLQTWLYHADLLGSLAAPWCGRPPVVWNIRHATLSPGIDSRSTLWAARFSGWMSSRSPSAIVINTRSGQDVHTAAGYDATKFRLIPNGFDLQQFRPSTEARISLRRELALADDTPLIGLIARYSRLKGHDIFVAAMRQAAAAHPRAQFVMCGRDVDSSNIPLMKALKTSECGERFHLLGTRDDVPRVQAALDLAVCPSLSEAFSNSIGEALACGVPCVASDVGDSAHLIANAGGVVPPGDATALGEAVTAFLNLSERQRLAMSHDARRRIEDHYDIQKIALAYQELWTQTAEPSRARQRTLRRAA
jgi:glycosyltransferase involved in cell wall biosynthesis